MIEFMSHGCHQWTKVLVSTSIDHFQFDCDPLPSQSQEGDFWVEGFDAVTSLARMSNIAVTLNFVYKVCEQSRQQSVVLSQNTKSSHC